LLVNSTSLRKIYFQGDQCHFPWIMNIWASKSDVKWPIDSGCWSSVFYIYARSCWVFIQVQSKRHCNYFVTCVKYEYIWTRKIIRTITFYLFTNWCTSELSKS
jgi:hypothetical protein